MNKDWSEKNKTMQELLKKEDTFKDGIKLLLELRAELFASITDIVQKYPAEMFADQPFVNAKGNHSFTLGWSIFHVFRIEDIVCHELIQRDQQIFFAHNYGEKISTKCITTANEFDGAEIGKFSKTLNIPALYEYAKKVMEASNAVLDNLTFKDLKKKFTQEDKDRLAATGCVHPTHPDAWWLIDYWCDKTVKGLIQMPFSRHWIMHVEGMERICSKL